MSQRMLATNMFWSLLSHLLSRGSQMLAVIVLARALDVTEFAAYSYFQLTVWMLASYSAMGLGVTASRFFAEVGHERIDRDPPPLGTLWSLSILFALIASIVVLLLPGDWLSAGLDVPRWMLAFGVFVLAAGVVPGGAVLGLEKYRQVSIVSAANGITLLLGVWLAARNHSAVIGMVALLLAFIVQTIGESVLTVREVGAHRLAGALRFQRRHVTRLFEFAGPMLFVTLMSASGSWLLGRLILRGQGGEHDFALYTIGLQWFGLALVLPAMLSRVLLPRLVRTGESVADINGQRLLVRRGAWVAMLVATAMAGFGVLFGPWLLSMYGTQYGGGRWFIGAFMIAAICSAPANVIGNAIVVKNGQMRWLLLTAIWFLVLLVTAVLFSAAGAGAWSGAIAHAMAAVALTLLAITYARSRQLI